VNHNSNSASLDDRHLLSQSFTGVFLWRAFAWLAGDSSFISSVPQRFAGLERVHGRSTSGDDDGFFHGYNNSSPAEHANRR